MIKAAVIRWFLYALSLRFLKLRDRWLRPRVLSEVDANLAHVLFVEHEAIAAESGRLGYQALLRHREFRVFSQNGEDGLLAFIFSEIGVTNRQFVEFGVDDGRECNCANLAIWFGWSGLMLEGNARAARRARDYYAKLERSGCNSVQVHQAHVTAENINQTILAAGVEGEIDLLSIDIDGNDYWLWEAIEVVNPRVVVIEYNASFGLRSISVPYDPQFVRFRRHPSGWYHGASVVALEKLGERKGYELVGTDSRGVNAFFVRKDALSGRLRALPAKAAYRPQKKRMAVATVDQQFDVVQHLDYVGIS